MKWYKARNDAECSRCEITIPKGEKYWGNSTSAFCANCKEERKAQENAKKLL